MWIYLVDVEEDCVVLIKNVQGMEMKAEQYARCIIDNLQTEAMPSECLGGLFGSGREFFWTSVAGISRHVRRCRLERYFDDERAGVLFPSSWSWTDYSTAVPGTL